MSHIAFHGSLLGGLDVHQQSPPAAGALFPSLASPPSGLANKTPVPNEQRQLSTWLVVLSSPPSQGGDRKVAVMGSLRYSGCREADRKSKRLNSSHVAYSYA